MNADQDYGFDVAGFLHLPAVLSEAEVTDCNRAIDAVGRHEGMLEWPAPWCDAFRVLDEHPVLEDFLESLCGSGYVRDCAPALLGTGPDSEVRLGAAGDPERSRRLRYVSGAAGRVCHGVRVIWALESVAEGVLLVPASHKRGVEPPADFADSPDYLGMAQELKMQAGDLLIHAATLLHGLTGDVKRGLLATEYISARAMPSSGYAVIEAPDWLAELSPEQRAVIGKRTTGRGGTVVSDGVRAKVAAAAVESPATVAYNLDSDSVPDPLELWFWDVRGYLVLRGVMDEAWLAAANSGIDATMTAQASLPKGHPSAIEEVPEQALRENDWVWPEDTSPRLRGDIHRPRLGGLYHLPKPHCDPFRRMIAHPAIVKRLNWMLGYGFKESTEPMCCVYPRGTTGGSLHGQNPGGYAVVNGRPYVEQVNVAWALQDEAPGFGDDSGGFICVPGSHKAAYPIPRPLTTSIDLTQVYKPPLKAGDVLLFGAVAHGTTAWRSVWERRTTIQFMSSSNTSTRPATKAVGWRWSSDPNNPANTLSA